MATPTLKLYNGHEIPILGLGTWQAQPNEVALAVEHALKVGYRHLDCAWNYRNESGVGEGIRKSGVPRSEIFITSKLWSSCHNRVEEVLDETLANLGTDYLDLYLIHWPVVLNPNGNHPIFPLLPDGKRDVLFDWKLEDTWKRLENAVKKGKIRSIGLSNFSEKFIEEKILPYAEILPAVDQLEIHLYNPQHKLVAYLKSKNIVPQAFSPLGSTNSPLLADETASAIATKYELKPADVLLGWLVAKEIVTLPKSVTPSRIESNLKSPLVAASKLTKEDIAQLDGVAASGKQLRMVMPPWRTNFHFDNWTNVTWE